MNNKQKHKLYMREYYVRRPLYKRWTDMRNRCNNLNSPDYKNYGGRGIKCLWNSYESFIADMLPSYSSGLTLDRINVNSHYCKENCRWIPRSEQTKNQRKNIHITFKGETKLFSEWADSLGISRSRLYQRLYYFNWPLEKAFSLIDGRLKQ